MSACAFSVTGDDSSAARSLATIYEFSSGPTAACMPPWGFTCVDMSERDRPGQRGFLPCYESDSSDSTRYVGAMPLEWSGEVRRRRCRRPCRLPDGRGGARASLLPSAAIYGRLRPPRVASHAREPGLHGRNRDPCRAAGVTSKRTAHCRGRARGERTPSGPLLGASRARAPGHRERERYDVARLPAPQVGPRTRGRDRVGASPLSLSCWSRETNAEIQFS